MSSWLHTHNAVSRYNLCSRAGLQDGAHLGRSGVFVGQNLGFFNWLVSLAAPSWESMGAAPSAAASAERLPEPSVRLAGAGAFCF
jgi:hypothetical protein